MARSSRVAVLFIAGLVLLAIGVVWWALWRALNGDKQVEPGGSYSRQVFGRNREPKKPNLSGRACGAMTQATLPAPHASDLAMTVRRRVVVYVEREDGLLVFEHRDQPEAGTQVPAGGVEEGESVGAAANREVREETGVELYGTPVLLGTHEHLDGLGQPALSYFFRAPAPSGLPQAWEHAVSGDGEDAALVFDCLFDPAPKLWPVQSIFRPVGDC